MPGDIEIISRIFKYFPTYYTSENEWMEEGTNEQTKARTQERMKWNFDGRW